MIVNICDIKIADRIRKDNGDLQELMQSIKNHGLINPVTLMESDPGYLLIAGFRRLSAIKLLGMSTVQANVLSLLDAEEQLRLEIEENESRKQFTASERVDYAKKLEEIEKEKSRMRMSAHARDGYSQGWDNCPTPEEERKGTRKRRTRDELAKKVGFSSGKQLQRATYVAENRPDLMQQVDEGRKTVSGAYKEAKGLIPKPNVCRTEDLPDTAGIIHGKLGHTGGTLDKAEDFRFVLDELQSAANYYLIEIQAASSHYSEVMQSTQNNRKISISLRSAFHAAIAAFGDNYIEEEE